jgi:hypothetical protein
LLRVVVGRLAQQEIYYFVHDALLALRRLLPHLLVASVNFVEFMWTYRNVDPWKC